jgi:hypothetical protein
VHPDIPYQGNPLLYRMNPRLSLFSLGALLAVSGSSLTPSAQARTWTSTDGKPLQAIFLGIEGENLKFRLQNGNQIAVPKDRFIKPFFFRFVARRVSTWRAEALVKLSNRPYHAIVSEMLTAQGNVGQNPASGFLLRDTQLRPGHARHRYLLRAVPRSSFR